MTHREALDDPEIAATAWRRFRRIMAWMALGATLCVGLALLFLFWRTGALPFHMVIATSLGVWLTFMLGTGLMALVFLSSGTGHDEQVMDRVREEVPLDD